MPATKSKSKRTKRKLPIPPARFKAIEREAAKRFESIGRIVQHLPEFSAAFLEQLAGHLRDLAGKEVTS